MTREEIGKNLIPEERVYSLRLSRFGLHGLLYAGNCRVYCIFPDQVGGCQAEQRHKELFVKYCINSKNLQEKLKEL